MKEYYWPQITKEKLLKLGFRFSPGYTCEECEAYITRVPVYKWNDITTLEAKIVAYLDEEVRISIIDKGSGGIYAAYELESVEKYPIIKIIDKNLNKILNKWGIRIKNENKTTHRNSSKTN